MTEHVRRSLKRIDANLRARRLYGHTRDSLSLRTPGKPTFVLTTAGSAEMREVSFASPDDSVSSLHASVYRARSDAGAVVVGETRWSAALSATGCALPALFDEQARHLGATRAPVGVGSEESLVAALRGVANTAIYGAQRVCLGSTPNRVVLNADLFEKCAKAFVIARASGLRVRPLPIWMRHSWSRRLSRDQARAARAYAEGRIPEGMDAY